MDIRATEEQRALVATASALFRRTPASAPDSSAEAAALATSQWSAFFTAGLAGLGVPLDVGGEGGSGLEQALVMEEAGKALLAAPLASSYAALSALAGDASAKALVPALLASGQPTLLLLDGASDLTSTCGSSAVSFTSQADLWPESQVLIPVPARERLELHKVAGRDVVVTVVSDLDASRPRASADDQLVASQVIGEAGGDLLRSARRRHQVLLAAECVGIGQACLDLAVEHVTVREAFGRPIAAYQAVAFPLADTYADLTLSRALVHRAAWALDHDPGAADSLAAAALSLAGEAAVLSAERAIQAHGGIGMTWDSVLHRYYKRALATSVTYGGAVRLRRDVLALTLAP